jgi:hypothetical protein
VRPVNTGDSGLPATVEHPATWPENNYDIFEGTAEIQQLVISRAISGMYIR